MKNNHKKYVDQLRASFRKYEAEQRKKQMASKKYMNQNKKDMLQDILDKKFDEFFGPLDDE